MVGLSLSVRLLPSSRRWWRDRLPFHPSAQRASDVRLMVADSRVARCITTPRRGFETSLPQQKPRGHIRRSRSLARPARTRLHQRRHPLRARRRTPRFSATNFAGVGNGFTGPQGSFTVNSAPPDTTGAVGPNHYVQMVNSDFAVFDKSGDSSFRAGRDQHVVGGLRRRLSDQQRR